MTSQRLATPVAVGFGVVYVLMGIAETTRAILSGDGGVPFWFGSLVGGGALVLVGTIRFRDQPKPRITLVTVGCLAGALATAWTILLPLVAVAVIWLTIAATRHAVE